jgi:molybdopterin synthase sulfur carrier subunit
MPHVTRATHVVHLPLQLREIFGIEGLPKARGGTVREIFNDLDRRFPGIFDRLCDGERLRPFVLTFIEDEQAAIDTRVPKGSDVRVVGAVAGG